LPVRSEHEHKDCVHKALNASGKVIRSTTLTSRPHKIFCMATTAAEVSSPNPDYTNNNSPKSTRFGFRRAERSGSFRSTIFPLYGPLFELDTPTPLELEVPVPAASREAYARPLANGADLATRALNITVAALGLLLAAPLFVAIALLIKITSRGPVFYKQKRVGLDRRGHEPESRIDSRRVHDLGGKPFTMYKFRTMVIAAEQDSREVWAKPRDERVTAIGRHLRTSRLDELPQLLNVLMGDMNIVGPRPERPTIFAEMRQAIPNYHLRQRVMPGITGWAQVNQAYDTCVDDVRRKVEYDLEYLQTRSAARDLRIMARTVPIMLFCRFGW
jgi:lipopolysaccharide/colanic/teichoic acid biosynthesis glycosyltransferase